MKLVTQIRKSDKNHRPSHYLNLRDFMPSMDMFVIEQAN